MNDKIIKNIESTLLLDESLTEKERAIILEACKDPSTLLGTDLSSDSEAKYYRYKDLEKRWRLSLRTIQRYVKDGYLHPKYLGNAVLFERSEVVRFEEEYINSFE